MSIFDNLSSFSPSQLKMAKVIAKEFRKAGLPANIAAAAIANAWHESRLNPEAVGDNGQSVGLFQLYDRGAGAGMTVEERKDPKINTQKIIKVVQGKLDKFQPALHSIAEATKVFTIYVEVPANRYQKAEERAETARQFFPTDVVTYGAKPLIVALLFMLPMGITFATCYYVGKKNPNFLKLSSK